MMKATEFFNGLRAYVAFVVVALMTVSCDSCKDELLPEVHFKPAVAIKPAENVTMVSATIVAKIVPNEDGTSVSFEYNSSENSTWIAKTLPLTFNGKDSVKVTFDLSDLKAGTDYSFRVKAVNAGGPVTSPESKFSTYAVADYDGNLYHTITIGTQTFLKENFRGTHYANGDAIPNVTNPTTWGNLTTGAYCWYNNDPEIGKVYGGLYNWFVGADPRGLIVGWHVPTFEQLTTLYMYLGQYQAAGPKMMETGSAHWKNTIVLATNSTGFTALPNGRFGLESTTNVFTFMEVGETATFWSSSLFGPGADAGFISAKTCFFEQQIYGQQRGFGLRLIKN